MALLPERVVTPLAPPSTASSAVAEGRFRRCTFRRVDVRSAGRALPIYDVACLFPDRQAVRPLGDLASAQPICAACMLPGVFRPDAD